MNRSPRSTKDKRTVDHPTCLLKPFLYQRCLKFATQDGMPETHCFSQSNIALHHKKICRSLETSETLLINSTQSTVASATAYKLLLWSRVCSKLLPYELPYATVCQRVPAHDIMYRGALGDKKICALNAAPHSDSKGAKIWFNSLRMILSKIVSGAVSALAHEHGTWWCNQNNAIYKNILGSGRMRPRLEVMVCLWFYERSFDLIVHVRCICCIACMLIHVATTLVPLSMLPPFWASALDTSMPFVKCQPQWTVQCMMFARSHKWKHILQRESICAFLTCWTRKIKCNELSKSV